MKTTLKDTSSELLSPSLVLNFPIKVSRYVHTERLGLRGLRNLRRILGDFYYQWWGQHSAFSSIAMAFVFPCKIPKSQLKAEGNPFYLPPLPLQSVDLFGAGKRMVFTPLPGGLAAGNRPLLDGLWRKRSGSRMRKNTVKGSARAVCGGPEASYGSWVHPPWLRGMWVPGLGLGSPSSTYLQGPEQSPFNF